MRTPLLFLTLILSTLVQAQPTKNPGQRVQIADLSLAIPGKDSTATAAPEFFYAFEAGDAVLLDITMDDAPGTNDLLVSTYPAGVEVHHDRAVPSLSIQKFTIRERGIYRFTLSSNHAAARNALVKVWRNSASAATQEFNSNVVWKKIYTPVQVSERQDFFVNSETKVNGNTRTALPVMLPPNTVEWYYRYTASRDQADVDRVASNGGLFGDIAKAIASGGVSVVVSSIMSMFTQPPGEDYCDIFLLDPTNYSGFVSQRQWKFIGDGTRQNFMSGNVRVTCCPTGQYYLGLQNNEIAHGVHVFLDVVAITAVEDWVMEVN